MADISFDEDQQAGRPRQIISHKKSFFIRLALGTGLVKTDKGAQYLLIGTAVVMLLIAGWLVVTSVLPKPPPPLDSGPPPTSPSTTN
jgi:hypothetical protein